VALTREFETFARDLFSELGEVKSKRMFGGGALYHGELIFALLDDDAIWIKVDGQSEPVFAEQGLPKFSYPMKDGRLMEMDYRRLPDEALDDPAEAARWGRMGIEAALRKKAAKPPRKPRKN